MVISTGMYLSSPVYGYLSCQYLFFRKEVVCRRLNAYLIRMETCQAVMVKGCPARTPEGNNPDLSFFRKQGRTDEQVPYPD